MLLNDITRHGMSKTIPDDPKPVIPVLPELDLHFEFRSLAVLLSILGAAMLIADFSG
jgi:hypothetical protein